MLRKYNLITPSLTTGSISKEQAELYRADGACQILLEGESLANRIRQLNRNRPR